MCGIGGRLANWLGLVGLAGLGDDDELSNSHLRNLLKSHLRNPPEVGLFKCFVIGLRKRFEIGSPRLAEIGHRDMRIDGAPVVLEKKSNEALKKDAGNLAGIRFVLKSHVEIFPSLALEMFSNLISETVRSWTSQTFSNRI